MGSKKVDFAGHIPDDPRADLAKNQVKKVPLTAVIDGVKTVIGEAYVDIQGTNIDVTGSIDVEYARLISAPFRGLSMGPFTENKEK